MNCSKIITSIGLAIDLIGTLFVAVDYWRPQVISKYESSEKEMFDTTPAAKRVQEQAKNYPYARYGLILLVIGFIIQIIAQLV